MSPQGLVDPLAALKDRSTQVPVTLRLPRWWWLNCLLLAAALITTTTFGSALVTAFQQGRPLDARDIVESWFGLAHGDTHLLRGLVFSGPLLLILLMHELGHYVVCLLCRVDATLPFFLPSPTLFGTLGAFIRIRTPIYTRRDLFDIGIAGPIAGFLTLLPILIAGVWLSHPLALGDEGSSLIVAAPLAVRLLEHARFGGLAADRILLHPMAISALGGLLTTALNLLPLGQLDGGHISYALFGQRGHRFLATGVVALLVILGWFYWPWWLWACVMFFFGRRHPLVYDEEPLGAARRWLAVAALLIFALSLSIVPTHT